MSDLFLLVRDIREQLYCTIIRAFQPVDNGEVSDLAAVDILRDRERGVLAITASVNLFAEVS